MSIFNDLLPKISNISDGFVKSFNDDLQAALQSLDKFGEEFLKQNGRRKTRDKVQKDKNTMITLQSIDEDEAESKKDKAAERSSSGSSHTSDPDRPKKRSKNEVEGITSPAQDKRQKRNASVKAQSIISKQVNVNLTQKLRRENSDKDIGEPGKSMRSRKDDEKENVAPNLPIQIKQEKVSLPPEPEQMDTESLPLDVPVKQEINRDDVAMPPPLAPVPRPRKAVPKEKAVEDTSDEEGSGRRSRRNTRNKKPDPPVAATRSTRASSRARPTAEPEQAEPAPEPEARPKRTRGRKKLSDSRPDSGHATLSSQESLPGSPAEKPRPKRTRRGQKADKDANTAQPETFIKPKEEKSTTEQIPSPVLTLKEVKSAKNNKNTTHTIIELDRTKESTRSDNSYKDATKNLANDTDPSAIDKDKNDTESVTIDNAKNKTQKELTKEKVDKIFAKSKLDRETKANLEKENDMATKLVENVSKTNGLVKKNSVDQVDGAENKEVDQTRVLSNGVYDHAAVSPKNVHMNETMVLDKTVVLDKPNHVMDATVVLERVAGPPSADDSLLTDDDSQEIPATPPRPVPNNQPTSAVKEKVQQFEEMASRVTRTKTRAMAKKEEDNAESQTPPDKVSKVVLSAETLSKMNNFIFNGKAPVTSSSACKPRAAAASKSVTSSASKASSLARWKDAEQQSSEDARRKKEALLEARREQQKTKREQKMAAAAALRIQAEQTRAEARRAAEQERRDREQQKENDKAEKQKEAEKKKAEQARKAQEMEERRRAEDAARRQRLADDQRRAELQRQRQLDEQEAMRREEARMNKEIERKHREYLEKQRRQKIEKMHTPFRTQLRPPLPPAHMEDGFQYLISDEDAEPPPRPALAWSTRKARLEQLRLQARVRRGLVDRLFSVGVHSPDLSEIFPEIERARLKRTSSAVWHTPPPPPPARN